MKVVFAIWLAVLHKMWIAFLFPDTAGERPLFLFLFVFNPRWDMHSLRAKEIKDSLNSQAVPKILVLLKNGTVWFHNCSD